MCTQPMAGAGYSNWSRRVTGARGSGYIFAATRPLPTRRSTSSSESKARGTRSSCRPAQAPGSSTAARGPPLLCQLQLPGAELEEPPPSGGESLAASRRAYPRVGFILTSLARPAERVVAFYNQRGTAEQRIKEGKGAVKWTRLCCHAVPSPPTPSGFSSTRWPATLAISCGRWRCPRRRNRDR